MINKKPINKPVCINFSSGPCTKRPGWSVNSLDNALLGRSHRSKEGKIKLKDAIEWMSERIKNTKIEKNVTRDKIKKFGKFKIFLNK